MLDNRDLHSAAAVIDDIPRWVSDGNGVAPHSAVGELAPPQDRARQHEQRTDEGRRCLANWGALRLIVRHLRFGTVATRTLRPSCVWAR